MFGWSFRASDLAQAEHFYSGEPEGERVCAPFDLGLKSKILGHLHGAICHRCHQNDPLSNQGMKELSELSNVPLQSSEALLPPAKMQCYFQDADAGLLIPAPCALTPYAVLQQLVQPVCAPTPRGFE